MMMIVLSANAEYNISYGTSGKGNIFWRRTIPTCLCVHVYLIKDANVTV